MSAKTANGTITDAQLDALIAKSEVIEHDLIKQANQQMIDEKKKLKVEGYKRALGHVSRHTQAAVVHLRVVRKQEKEAKERTLALHNAEQAFLKDGNILAYAKVLYPNSERDQRYFVDNFRELVTE